jgi:hypothetical protein
LIIHTDMKHVGRMMKADAKRIERAIRRAAEKTAVKAAVPIKRRVPKAFGELADSVQGYPRGDHGHPVTSVDAPHAGSVERGSKPHTPDFDRLVAWVRLRGFQGLTRGGRLRKRFRKSDGPTTPAQARRVATMLRGLEVRGKKGIGRHSPADAAVQVAQAISKGIQEHGTRPHWYVRESLPEIRQILADQIRYEVIERKQTSHAGHAPFPLVQRK